MYLCVYNHHMICCVSLLSREGSCRCCCSWFPLYPLLPPPSGLGRFLLFRSLALRKKMNHGGSSLSSCSSQDPKVPVFCPKPRRIAKDLGVFLTKKCEEEDSEIPPFFCGSPPSRATNPLIHDARFLEMKSNNIPLKPLPFLSSNNPYTGAANSSPPTTGLFGTTINFGPPAPVPVRIEGFDCLNRDNRVGCSIPAFA